MKTVDLREQELPFELTRNVPNTLLSLFYPAVFIPEDDGGFSVFFPDIPGCNTCGDTIEQAYEMAFEALGLVLSYIADNKEPIPQASMPQDIKPDEGQFLAIIEVGDYLIKLPS